MTLKKLIFLEYNNRARIARLWVLDKSAGEHISKVLFTGRDQSRRGGEGRKAVFIATRSLRVPGSLGKAEYRISRPQLVEFYARHYSTLWTWSFVRFGKRFHHLCERTRFGNLLFALILSWIFYNIPAVGFFPSI